MLRDIEVMDKVEDAGITVGESKSGIFILTAYELGHSLDKFWENKAGQHLARVTDPSEKVQLDSIIPNNEDDINMALTNQTH